MPPPERRHQRFRETTLNFKLRHYQLQTYLSPSATDKLTWGIGPVLQFPSATNGRKLGTQKWSAGPGLVVLTQPGKWVIGELANNL